MLDDIYVLDYHLTMLKTEYKNKIYFITQPDHAKVSGFLAAHWGNEEFARPGYYSDSQDPDRLRAETVLGIAEHDNGWWEWEASPEPDADGLPKGLTAVLKNQQEGMSRWENRNTQTQRKASLREFTNKLPRLLVIRAQL